MKRSGWPTRALFACVEDHFTSTFAARMKKRATAQDGLDGALSQEAEAGTQDHVAGGARPGCVAARVSPRHARVPASRALEHVRLHDRRGRSAGISAHAGHDYKAGADR